MDHFIKQIIEEKFASKKQQKFFFAKANDKSLSKEEKKKWSKWANEFSSKTNFKKLPEKVEKDVDEDYTVMNTDDDNFNKDTLYHYTVIAYIDTNKRIKKHLDSIEEVQDFANRMVKEKSVEALEISRIDQEGINKILYYIYDQDNDSWTKVKTLPYKEFNKSEGDIDEVVDYNGNIIRGTKPTDANTKGVTQKRMTDRVVKSGMGMMGTFGIAGGGNTHRTLRYWAESDMSKMLGYENTLGDNEDYETAKEYFQDDLGLTPQETEERLDQMGYDEQLPDEKVRLVETPKKFIEEYIESLLSKKNKPNDIVEKDNVEKNVTPIIKKQLKVLLKTLEKNNLSLKDVLSQIENDEQKTDGNDI